MIKVIILISSISRSAGGLFDAVKDLYLPLKEKLKLKIISFTDENTDKDYSKWGNISIQVFQSNNKLQYSKEYRDYVMSYDGDILHVHGLWRYPHAVIAKWKSKNKKPVLVTPHGMLDPYILANQGRLKKIVGFFLFKKAFKSIDCYHALSQAELEAIRAYGVTKPIAIIPNGINLPDLSTEFEKADNKKHLLFLARLHPKKGVDILLEAIANIKDENPDLLNGWVVDIVGWSHGNFDVALKDIVAKNNLQDIVIFHGGLFGNNKLAMYANASAYILPSHGEGLPMTILEAWSWGLPVIMTSQCNIPEGFEHSAAIKIENNKDSVKEGIIQLFYMSLEEQKEMGEKGRQLVIKKFTWKLSAEKMNDLYLWMLGKISEPDFINNY